MYMKEQYTTQFLPVPWIDGTLNSDQPDEWYYKNGDVTNNRDGDRKFIYIHFMNFKSSHWRHDGTKATWEDKTKICSATVDQVKAGIVINADGISPINKDIVAPSCQPKKIANKWQNICKNNFNTLLFPGKVFFSYYL